MKKDWGCAAKVCRSDAFEATKETTGKHVVRFGREEDGTATVLSFFVFITILLMAGLGVDTMRHEMERTHLQATLDSAVLAGAGQPTGSEVADVKLIVEDYFDKNQMSQYLHAIDTDGEGTDDIETSLNSTRVYAEGSMEVDTYLLNLSGVDTLTATGAAEAQVATPKLEVSLVLDVSGSMWGDKMTNMQTAANSFVTTILDQSDPGDSVISVVPFSFNVTPGWEIFNALTTNKSHDYSSCLRFDNNDYSEMEIDPDVAYDQQIFTSVYGGFNDLNDGWRSCFNDANAEIFPYSTNETDLHGHINALTASGNTSAHIGMKWGAALLDDEFQDVVTDLQTAGVVDATLANIPAVHGESETLKVIVLMADGKNTESYYFNDNGSYRGANSDLYLLTWSEVLTTFDYAWRYRNNGTIRYSYNEDKCSNSKWTCEYTETRGDEQSAYYLYDDYWDEYLDVEEVGPSIGYWWNSDYWVYADEFDDFQDDPEFISLERLSWETAWGLMSPDFYYDKIDSGPWNDYVGSNVEWGSTKDTRLQAICTATKNQNVVVYTIGYDITAGGNAETQLEDCASSGNHYYPTNGSNIAAAFNSIASNVKNLRLTQ
jgi:Flp pilus assembly protein TadG